MLGSGYFTRLAAMLFVAALMIGAIAYPRAGHEALSNFTQAAQSFEASLEKSAAAERPCPVADAAFSGPFAPIDDVLSVSPLGGVTAPGETLPAPYIRINMRSGETAFQRRTTNVLAPARADITAIERHVERDEDGRAKALSWSIHFSICEAVSFYYGRIDKIDEKLLQQAGGLGAFTELGGPDHMALTTKIRVQTGSIIGEADGFDVALHDQRVTPALLEAPERYNADAFSRAEVLGAAPELINAISPPIAKARCALDYLPHKLRDDWKALLGDAWGIRRARGANACRLAVADKPGAARGVWFTDAAHNAAVNKVSAVALSDDVVDPTRQIFALHGRLTSLTPSLVAVPPMMDAQATEAAKDFLSFKQGNGRINTDFDDVRDSETYCYERMRVNFVGPQINGVILLRRSTPQEGPALLTIEARGDVMRCIDLNGPWSFSGNETVFYR